MSTLTITLLTSLALLSGARDPDYEARAQAQLETIQPGLGEVLRKATQDSDDGRSAAAAEGFEKITTAAPKLGIGFRRLGRVRLDQGRFDEGVALTEHAVEVEPNTQDELALAAALYWRAGSSAPHGDDETRARTLAQKVIRETKAGSDEWVSASQMDCAVAAKADADAACAERVLAVDDSPLSNFSGVRSAAMRGHLSLARARLEKARPAISAGTYQKISAMLDENEPLTSRWGPTLGLVGGGWLAALLVMALLGLLLSALTLMAARTLATQKELHPSTATRGLRALYRLVLGFASVFYYVSLPIVALAVIGVFGGVIYACFALGRIPIKLVLLAVVVGGASIFALIKSVFVRSVDEDPGRELDWAKAPRLRAFIDDIAAKVGTRTVDTVFITPTTDLAVFERGGYLQKLGGRGHRCLVIGRGVLEGFKRSGFRSVLAHELGHFSNQDTAGGSIALVGRRSLLRMGIALAQSGAAGWYNPAWLFFRAYHAIYLRISQGASRLQEVLADRIAIFAYGSAAFSAGYRHVIEQSVRFDSHVNRTIHEVVGQKLPLGNLYRFAPSKPESSESFTQQVQEAIDRPAGPYDSHPCSRDRLAWSDALGVQVSPSADEEEPVLTLFDDLEVLERQLTDEVRVNVAMNHNVRIDAPTAAPDVALPG